MNTNESMSIGKRLIEEMNDASWNAAMQAAAQIADKKAAALLVAPGDVAELRAGALLCTAIATEIKKLKR